MLKVHVRWAAVTFMSIHCRFVIVSIKLNCKIMVWFSFYYFTFKYTYPIMLHVLVILPSFLSLSIPNVLYSFIRHLCFAFVIEVKCFIPRRIKPTSSMYF